MSAQVVFLSRAFPYSLVEDEPRGWCTPTFPELHSHLAPHAGTDNGQGKWPSSAMQLYDSAAELQLK